MPRVLVTGGYLNIATPGYPDHGLPEGPGGHPDNELPGQQPGIDNSLPMPPPGVFPPPTIANPIVPIPPGTSIPPGTIWPSPPSIDHTLPGGRPARPDNSLPSGPGRPDNSLPPSPARPDNSLPPSPARPDNSLPPSPARPDNSLPPSPARPDNSLPGSQTFWMLCYAPNLGWKYVAVDPSLKPGMPLPPHPQPK